MDDPNAGNAPGNVARPIRAGVVDHENFVGLTGLGKQCVEDAGR